MNTNSLTAQQKGTTGRWYSNKTSLLLFHLYEMSSIKMIQLLDYWQMRNCILPINFVHRPRPYSGSKGLFLWQLNSLREEVSKRLRDRLEKMELSIGDKEKSYQSDIVRLSRENSDKEIMIQWVEKINYFDASDWVATCLEFSFLNGTTN